MLKVQNVHKSFQGNEVLKGVDISVEKGDVVVILGPSGSGKTTLLRCMNFLEKADQGTLTLDGKETPLAKAHKKEIHEIRMKTGFVFQNYNLFQNKTALENVTEGLVTARKIPKKEAAEIGKKALDKVGLSQRYDFYPHQLSGGQQQRVGIARAIATDPEVIFFDEPTSALDPELVGEVLNTIKAVAQTGITMIVVTHEIAFAKEVATRVVFMEGGKVVEQGSPSEILVNPKEPRTQQFLSRITNPNQASKEAV